MTPLDDQQQAARDWFESLRTRICAEFARASSERGSTRVVSTATGRMIGAEPADPALTQFIVSSNVSSAAA